MIYSMTGYGKAEKTVLDKTISIEIRSLNSKQLDLSLRLPQQYRHKELDIRNLFLQRLERGKVDCAVSLSYQGAEELNFTPINHQAAAYYLRQLKLIARDNDLTLADDTALLAAILRIPDVMRTQEESIPSAEETEALMQCLNSAIDAFVAFRQQEGAALENMFRDKLNGIEHLLHEVEKYETGRIDNIRQRLENNLRQLSEQTQAATDLNRLEQEMIYYLEKLDITEEKVRLTNHIRYFRETMDTAGAGVGKKLGFIAQEMGREINTLGSKSNQSEMQIIVVKMKDLLEQIKEQVLNVL